MTAFDSHANFAVSAVATPPSPATSGLSLTVAPGEGALFPASGPFNCVVYPPSVQPTKANAEIVRVASRAGDVFTIVRAQEGTAAQAVAIGWSISNAITAKLLTDLEAVLNGGFASPVFNVKQLYGAACDNATDDAAAINAAIVACNAAGGGIVYVPGQSYCASGLTLASNVRIMGPGRDFGKLRFAAGVTGILVPNNVTGWGLQGLTINGGAIGLKTNGETSDILMHDLIFSSQTGDAIQTDVFEDALVTHLKITGNGGHGWRTGVIVSGNGRFERNTLTDLRFDSCALDGMWIDGSVGNAETIAMSNATFINCGHNSLTLQGVISSTFINLNGEQCSTATDNTYDHVNISGGNRLTFLSCDMGGSAGGNRQRYCYHDNSNNNTFDGCTGAGAKTTVWSTGGSSTYHKCAGSGLAANQAAADQWLIGQLLLGAGAVVVASGAGTPEGAVTAPKGSVFLRTDGGAGTSFYVKESGTGNTGWVGK